MEQPRSEYPRPQFARKDWLCLNGPWQFEIDYGDSGIKRGLLDRALKDQIIVPFCPESELSGVGHVDFMNAVWYRREVEIPADWKGKAVLLHFGAIDYDATVWVNGQEVSRHRGGFSPVACDLRGVAGPGETATIVVRARDYHKKPQPMGKQSEKFENYGCLYTRTTGIWQTVWMEPVAEVSLKRTRITPDVANSSFHLEQPILGNASGLTFRVTLKNEGLPVAQSECVADGDFTPRLSIKVPAEHVILWDCENPHLYQFDLELLDAHGEVVDQVESYCGLRSVKIDSKAVLINGKAVFQRLVLDQGYYADGIMTAPTEQALVRDIELGLEAGFNGARLHQKVFEERFLYHCDRLGYLVWGEFADWGISQWGHHDDHQRVTPSYITEWLEVIKRDYSHPALIGWCPLNETYQTPGDRIVDLDVVTRGMFLATKALDQTRPVIDASGYSHRLHETDIYDSHDYDQNPETFKKRHDRLLDGKPWVNMDHTRPERHLSIPYGGQPYFVSEFGGIWWNPKAAKDEDSWGYGERPKTIDEFYERFEGLCGALLDNPMMFGYCYTQLTDVYQEQNGVYGFDRSEKFDMKRIREVQQRVAAIEEQYNNKALAAK